MAYWIYENGETVGPLNKEEVVQRAGPDTPVSHGQEWVKLEQHPDFAKPLEPPPVPPPVPPPTTHPEPEKPGVSEVQAAAPVEVAVPVFEQEKVSNPEDSDFRRVQHLAKASKPSVPEKSKKKTSLGGWVIIVAGLAITGFLAYAFLQSREAGSPWVYSKAFDIIDTKPDYWVDQDPQALVDGYRDTLESNYPNGQVTIDGSEAHIDGDAWQELDRQQQALLLRIVAVLSCQCFEPSNWSAEIRDASSGTLLAATSPNGLRALWTEEGNLPETPPDTGAVDTESPMSRAELIESLESRYETNRQFMRNHYRVTGEVAAVQRFTDPPPPFEKGITAVVVQGRAKLVEGSEIGNPLPSVYSSSSNSYLMIILPEDAEVSEGTWYDAVHTFTGVQEWSGQDLPMFLPGFDRELFRRYSEIQAAIQRDIRKVKHEIEASNAVEEVTVQTEARTPQTAAKPRSIDEKIAETQSQLRKTATALKPIEAEYKRLSYRHPTFNVSGEIRDRSESSVQLWGVALPSTGDITHLGALVQKGNIIVIGVTRVESPLFFAQEGLFFVEKTTAENTFGGTVPIRIYSTQLPPARIAAEQEFDRLRNEMRPYRLEIERLNGELSTLRQEKYRQEWEAVIDSVPKLLVYAKEHFESDDKEGSARACTRIEELAPAEADPFVECGLLAERAGDDSVAIARYREALSRDSYHPMANRREALLLSRQQEDSFEEARYLLRYEEYDDPTATDAQAVHTRLTELKDEWGREARRACLAFDKARIDQVQWDAMNKGPTYRESVARNISSCERAKAEARARLQTLNSRLVSINLDVQALMMNSRDDHDYWRSRGSQAAALRQQIAYAENSLKFEFQQEKKPIHRERIRLYQEILSEIESEARKVGISL